MNSFIYGDQTIEFRLRRTCRKNLAIHVHPDMSVEVVAPETADLENIYQKVLKRARWIREQQAFFKQFHPKMMPRQYASGETHLYLGRQLRLKIIKCTICDVKLKDGHILVASLRPDDVELTRKLVGNWLKERAQKRFKERLELCIQKFSNPEQFIPHSIIIRQLKNRWGSMTRTKKLVLNLNLIQAPLSCIDYVIVHELCHIQHPNHSAEFWKLLTSILPNWQIHKNKLEVCLN